MLILPLHQPISRGNFPWVTAALVLLNVMVFFLLQGGDEQAYAAASEHYRKSGLQKIEAPLYRLHLDDGVDAEMRRSLDAVPAEMRAQALAFWPQQDESFRARLRRGELFDDEAAFAQWQSLDSGFEALRQRVFTLRHALYADRPGIGSLLSSLFLHGDVMHLLGNLLFLIALGLLVEGPLGPALFAVSYLLGGVGAGLAWVWLGPGTGSLIGASGAIASLMGAFCVLWGLRKVRFFYWFFVVFDYVKAPALALLPLWLGWELLQWQLADGSPVAYEAHAGGIVAGALLALAVRRLGWQRERFFEADAQHSSGDPLSEAQALLRQLRTAEAAALLAELDAREPGRFDVALARLRCARYGDSRMQLVQSLQRVVGLAAGSAEELRERHKAALELLTLDIAPTVSDAQALLTSLMDAAALTEAAQLADALQMRSSHYPQLSTAQLRLSRELHAAGDSTQAIARLQALRAHSPHAPEAAKAQFLLREWGV